MSKGRILCYKTVESKKPTTYYTIIKGHFVDDDNNLSHVIRVILFLKRKSVIQYTIIIKFNIVL